MMQHVTKNEDFHAAVGTNAGAKPVVACFSAPWCGGCKLVAPKVTALAEELADKAAFVTVSAEELEQLCEEVEVDSFPHFRVYKEGKILGDYTSSKFDKVEAFIREHVDPKTAAVAEETPEAPVVDLTSESETPAVDSVATDAEAPADTTTEKETAAADTTEKAAEAPTDAPADKEADAPVDAVAEKAAGVPVEVITEKTVVVTTKPATGEASKKRSEREETEAESVSTEDGHVAKKFKTDEQAAVTEPAVAEAVEVKVTTEVIPPAIDAVPAEEIVSTETTEVVQDASAA